MYETNRQSRFDAGYRKLGAGALGKREDLEHGWIGSLGLVDANYHV